MSEQSEQSEPKAKDEATLSRELGEHIAQLNNKIADRQAQIDEKAREIDAMHGDIGALRDEAERLWAAREEMITVDPVESDQPAHLPDPAPRRRSRTRRS